MSTQELDDLTQHGMTLRHGSCSLKIRDAPFVDQKTWRTWFSCFTFQTYSYNFLQREEWYLESTLIKTLSLLLRPKSMSLHPPTPIPVLCLRKQVNQTQKSVGCDTNPGLIVGFTAINHFFWTLVENRANTYKKKKKSTPMPELS